MSYQPYDRNPSGIVFFGVSATDQVYESNSNFVYDTSNDRLSVGHISVNDGGYVGSDSFPNLLQLNANGTAQFASGLVIVGDLTVQGNTVTLDTATLQVEDNVILLNKNVTGTPALDAGLEIERGDLSNVKFVWDEGNDYWSFTNNGTNYHPVGVARSGLAYETAVGSKYFFDVVGGTGISVGSNGVNINVTSLADLITAANDDVLLIYDADTATHKKITRSNLLSGLGGGTMSQFYLRDEDGTELTIDNNKYVQIIGDVGIKTDWTDVSTGNTSDPYDLTISFDLQSLSAVAMASGDSFLVLDSNGSTHQRSTVSQLGTYLAGTNLTAGADGKLSVSNSAIESAVFDSANFVDSTTIDFTVTAGASVTASVKSNSISETQLTSSVAGNGLAGGNGTALSVNVDNSTIEINTDSLRVKDSGITEAKRLRTVDSTFANNDTITSDINLVTAGAGGITVKLPAPVSGKMVIVKKIDSGAGTVTVSRNSTETIDGAQFKILYYQYETLNFVSDGTNWFIV